LNVHPRDPTVTDSCAPVARTPRPARVSSASVPSKGMWGGFETAVKSVPPEATEKHSGVPSSSRSDAPHPSPPPRHSGRGWPNFGAGSNVCCLQVELATRQACLTSSVRRDSPLQWRVATSARLALVRRRIRRLTPRVLQHILSQLHPSALNSARAGLARLWQLGWARWGRAGWPFP
jgi:hypothetical protein